MSNSSVKTAFLIQARMGSSRLPGKVLMPFYQQWSILNLIINNLKIAFNEFQIIVCTSNEASDDPIAKVCDTSEVECFRGSNLDVLNRMISAAKFHNVDRIIRICADNPFLDMKMLSQLIAFADQNPLDDYYSYITSENTPVIRTHLGLFAEIVTLDALQKTAEATNDPFDHEHVTIYVYSNPGFICKFLPLTENIDRRDLRFTIDDERDFLAMQNLYFHYLALGDISKLIKFVDHTPEIKQAMIDNINKYSK